MKTQKKSLQLLSLSLLVLVIGRSQKFKEEKKIDFNIVKNEDGSNLGYNFV